MILFSGTCSLLLGPSIDLGRAMKQLQSTAINEIDTPDIFERHLSSASSLSSSSRDVDITHLIGKLVSCNSICLPVGLDEALIPECLNSWRDDLYAGLLKFKSDTPSTSSHLKSTPSLDSGSSEHRSSQTQQNPGSQLRLQLELQDQNPIPSTDKEGSDKISVCIEIKKSSESPTCLDKSNSKANNRSEDGEQVHSTPETTLTSPGSCDGDDGCLYSEIKSGDITTISLPSHPSLLHDDVLVSFRCGSGSYKATLAELLEGGDSQKKRVQDNSEEEIEDDNFESLQSSFLDEPKFLQPWPLAAKKSLSQELPSEGHATKHDDNDEETLIAGMAISQKPRAGSRRFTLSGDSSNNIDCSSP